MSDPRLLVCRCRFMLPLAGPARSKRIQAGYVLARGGTLLEAGPYDPGVGKRLLETWGSQLDILHTRRELPSAAPIASPVASVSSATPSSSAPNSKAYCRPSRAPTPWPASATWPARSARTGSSC